MKSLRTHLRRKVGGILLVLVIALIVFFALKSLSLQTEKSVGVAPVFTCMERTPDPLHAENKLVFGEQLSCYITYYREFVTALGAPAALADLRTRMTVDSYAKEECHQVAHAIGRSASGRAGGIAKAFAEGDSLCSAGYFHGVMEGLMQGRGTKELSSEFLNSLCGSFRTPGRTTLTVDHFDCAHGLGHGIMSLKNGEVFKSLAVCDILPDTTEARPCWTGVFMENVITDFKDHATQYLKPGDPMYPCSAVKKIYKDACYSFQTSYVLKLTKSFEKTFAACREIPDQYQNACFTSIGRDAAGMVDGDIAKTKTNCSFATNNREAENCVIGAVGALINHYHSDTEGLAFCSSLKEGLRKICSDAGRVYYIRTFQVTQG